MELISRMRLGLLALGLAMTMAGSPSPGEASGCEDDEDCTGAFGACYINSLGDLCFFNHCHNGSCHYTCRPPNDPNEVCPPE